MGAAQVILLLGSLTMLLTLSLTFYSAYRTDSDLSLNSEALATAISVSGSMFETIQTRAFDEKTITSPVYSTDSLTTASKLGKDSGELYPYQFDDIDDFNNYNSYDTLSVFGVFKTEVKLYYSSKWNPDIISSSRTFSKLVSIKVSNKYLADTLKFKQLITY